MNNLFGDYIKRKRQEMGLSLRKFGEICGLSHTHIDSIEKGIDFRNKKRVNLTNDTIQKLAHALNINEELLFSLSLSTTSEKFSFYYDFRERNIIKEKNFGILDSSVSSDEEKQNSVIEIFKCYYSRSIEANNFNISHVDFNTYIAMLLNQEHWKQRLPSTIFEELKNKYGQVSGIKEGETYYSIPQYDDQKEKSEDKLTPKDERDIAKTLEKALQQLELQQEALMFDGEPLDDETKELLKISLENTARMAKTLAKKKYTPKKYRKE